MHALQLLIVALLVPGCAAYAAWKLMPGTPRRVLAAWMLRTPHLPAPLAAAMRRATRAATGCACDGCDGVDRRAASSASRAQPIRIHRRNRD